MIITKCTPNSNVIKNNLMVTTLIRTNLLTFSLEIPECLPAEKEVTAQADFGVGQSD